MVDNRCAMAMVVREPVYLDRPGGDVVQARDQDQVADGGLAGSAWPDQGHEVAGARFEADAGQGVRRGAGVAEVDVPQVHPAARLGCREVDGAGGVDDVGHHVEVLEDPVEQGQR
jgi:hypothetical protein